MAGWNIVFWSCSGILLVGVIIYLLFATDSVQDWAKQDHDSNDNKGLSFSPLSVNALSIFNYFVFRCNG